jgi:hypothetical protein
MSVIKLSKKYSRGHLAINKQGDFSAKIASFIKAGYPCLI